MPKVHTTISIDSELLEEAKSKYINISGALDRALREKLNIKSVEIQTEEIRCSVCKREGYKETAEDVKLANREARLNNSDFPSGYGDKTKLTYLWPDEVWICNSCLITKIKSVKIAHG